MKLVFDARYIKQDRPDGISRYSVGLAGALAKITPVTFLVHSAAQLEAVGTSAPYILGPHPESWRETSTATVIGRAGGADVVFSPMQTMGASGRKFRLILTLHDLTHHSYPAPPHDARRVTKALWRPFHRTFAGQRVLVNRGDLIATVSESSKRAMIEAGIARKPVIVVPNAPTDIQLNVVRASDSRTSDLVYMGSFAAYKNIETLIYAMKWLPGRTLHILSRGAPERQKVLEAGIPAGASVRFHGGVSDAAYKRMLVSGAVLVNASLSEGFGLPLIEAQSFGAPIVVSDLPVFHEVAGDGALFFNPRNPYDLAQTVGRLDAAAVRSRVTKAGRANARRYSWTRSATILLTAAERLHAGPAA